jgi:hypothetical protein
VILETHGASFAPAYRPIRPDGACLQRAGRRMAQAEASALLVRLAAIGSSPDREERHSNDAIKAPAECCQSSPRLGPRAPLAPVGTPGSLVGSVVGPCGWLTQVRLLVRDLQGAVVRECFPSRFRSGPAGVRFEARALPASTYLLEVQAPGFCREVRHDVRVVAGCVTDVGIVRLMGVKKQHRRPAARVTHRRWVRGTA